MRILRPSRFFFCLGAALCTLLVSAQASAQQRPMAPDDILRLEELGDVAFSPDGKKLVFASNRGGKVPGETNLFVVDWVE